MEEAKDQETTLHSLFGRKVVRVGDNLAVKSGKNLRLHEAQTLQFIAENTTIPVPKVHDIRWDNGEVVAIVMDYIPGQRLDQAWETLDADQKLSIANELSSYLSQLHKLKGDYIGAINRGPAIVKRRAPLEGGPFDSEKQFNEFILGDIIGSAPDLLRHYAKFALEDNHDIVFTHADFAPRNILVDGGRVTAILDWEDAGWYPEYWEHIKAFAQFKPMPDWPDYLAHILPPRFEREYIGMSFLNLFSRH